MMMDGYNLMISNNFGEVVRDNTFGTQHVVIVIVIFYILQHLMKSLIL